MRGGDLLRARRRAIERVRGEGNWYAEAVGSVRAEVAAASGRAAMDPISIERWGWEMGMEEGRMVVLRDQSAVHVFLMDRTAALLFVLAHSSCAITVAWKGRGA